MYSYKEKYILDFTNVKDYHEIHEIIKKELDFPDYYGANWDAFWDCITDLALPEGINVEIFGLDKVYNKYPEKIDIFIESLKDLKHIYDNEYANVIKITIHTGTDTVELT